MRTITALAASACSSVFFAACGGPGPTVSDDVGEALAVEAGCEADCTVESAAVGTRFTLNELAHDTRGELVVVDDTTLAVEGFFFDGGGIDVRAVVAPSRAALRDDAARVTLSEDLRRPGGYSDARLSFPLPDGLTVDDVGAFSIWCVPFGASFADVELK